MREQLRSLARPVAEQVALRLVAAGELIDAEPALALEHALIARRLASRIAAIREAVGLAAYQAGEWQMAVAELRAYHRMTGRQTHLAVLADCERALGRPERAIDLFRATDRDQLGPDEAVELLIVAAGARGDLGQHDAAVSMLQVRELASEEPWVARLRYAYADALLAAGRKDEAREWFARAAEVDDDALTDAAERLLDLDGVVLDDLDEDEDDEDADSVDADTGRGSDESDDDEDESDDDEDADEPDEDDDLDEDEDDFDDEDDEDEDEDFDDDEDDDDFDDEEDSDLEDEDDAETDVGVEPDTGLDSDEFDGSDEDEPDLEEEDDESVDPPRNGRTGLEDRPADERDAGRKDGPQPS